MSDAIRVLVADDHNIVRRGIAAVLDASDGLQVVGEAENGEQAVDLARTLAPDVVLMDLQMPVMDGVSATRLIAADDEAPRVIILTTFDADEKIFEALQAGAVAYLLKDSPPEELVRAIKAVASGESFLTPRVASKILGRVTVAGSSDSSVTLSEREVEVLRAMALGSTNRQIAEQLVIGESTVKTHIIHIYDKLGVRDRTQAVLEASRRGIISV